MKMSFYKLLIISNLWGYLTACHAGGREFEPRPHRWKRSLALAKLRFFVFAQHERTLTGGSPQTALIVGRLQPKARVSAVRRNLKEAGGKRLAR